MCTDWRVAFDESSFGLLVFQFLVYKKVSSGIKMPFFQLSLSPNKAVVKRWLFSCFWQKAVRNQQRSPCPGGAEGSRGRHPARHKCHARSLRREQTLVSRHQRDVGLPTAQRATSVPTSLIKNITREHRFCTSYIYQKLCEQQRPNGYHYECGCY